MLFRPFSRAFPCSRRFSPPNFLLFLSCTMLFFGVKCDLDLVLCSKTLSHFYFAQSCEPCDRCAASRSWQGHTAGCTVLQKAHCRLHSYANGTMPQAMRCRTRNSTHPNGEGAGRTWRTQTKKGAGRAAARIQAEKAPFSWRVATKNSTFRMACPTKKGAFRKASFFVYIYILHNRRIRIKHFCYLYSNSCIQYMSNVFRRFPCSFFCT